MNDFYKNFNILIILPHSIGGRIIMYQFIEALDIHKLNFIVFDELFSDNFLEIFKSKNFNLLIGYDFSALKRKTDNNLDINCINYFADEIKDKHSGEYWSEYFSLLNDKSNYNFCWDKKICETQNEIENLYHQALFVNTENYKNLNLEKTTDILFAGRLDTDSRLDLFLSLMKSYPNLNFSWYAIEKHFQDALSRTEYKDLLKQAYKGFLDTPDKLITALNQAKIIINENSQGISSINFRTIESMACESIVLSDYREEMNLFKGDLPFYTNFEDLTQKIDYYLQNPTAYKSTTKACRQHVEKHHSAQNEILKILEKIK